MFANKSLPTVTSYIVSVACYAQVLPSNFEPVPSKISPPAHNPKSSGKFTRRTFPDFKPDSKAKRIFNCLNNS